MLNYLTLTDGSKVLTMGHALELVHEAGKRLLEQHGEITAKSRAEMHEALDMVEDFIVNQFGEDDDLDPRIPDEACNLDNHYLNCPTCNYKGTGVCKDCPGKEDG